ncbi:MAG: uroporphyrinogen-III synthase [Actinomycetota bacterium]
MTPQARGPRAAARVVVTRARAQSRSLVDRLEDLGAEVIVAPVIEIVDPPSWSDLDAAIGRLAQGVYDWVIFSSTNAVEKVWQRLGDAGLGENVFETSRTAAVGTTTASLLRDKGVAPTLVPAAFSGAELAAALGAGAGRVLVPRAATAPKGLPRALAANGWTVDDVPAYANRLPAQAPESAARVRAGDFDVLTFTSGSTVRNFVTLIAPPDAIDCSSSQVSDKLVACIGPETARTAAAEGFRVDVVPKEASVGGLVRALSDRFDGTIDR